MILTTATPPTTMFNNNTTISEEEREEYLEGLNWGLTTKLGPYLTYFALLMFVGLIGNCVIIAVYYKRYRPSVTRICVLTMGVVDLFTIIIAIPAEILRVRYHFNYGQAAWECKLHWAALSTLIVFSGTILVIVALVRKRLIFRRAAREPNSSLKKIKIILAIALGWSFFLSIPRFVIMGHEILTFPGTDITGVGCGEYTKNTFVNVYNGILMLYFISMFVAMNVSYGQIACFLWQHKKKRRHEKRKSGTGDKLRPKSEEDKKAETSFNNISDDNQPKAANQQTLNHDPNSNPTGESEKNHFNNQPNAFVNSTHPESDPHADYSTDSALDTEDESHTVETSTQMSELTSGAVGDVISSSPAGQEIPEKRPSYKRPKSQASRPRSHRRSKHGPQGKKIPTRTTLMLFVLSVIVVVNFVPFLVLNMLEKFKPHLTEAIEKNLFFLLTSTQYINSAANPLVYSFCSARFRYECKNLFRLKH